MGGGRVNSYLEVWAVLVSIALRHGPRCRGLSRRRNFRPAPGTGRVAGNHRGHRERTITTRSVRDGRIRMM